MKALEKLLISNIKNENKFYKGKSKRRIFWVFIFLEKVAYMSRIYLGFWSNEKIS